MTNPKRTTADVSLIVIYQDAWPDEERPEDPDIPPREGWRVKITYIDGKVADFFSEGHELKYALDGVLKQIKG